MQLMSTTGTTVKRIELSCRRRTPDDCVIQVPSSLRFAGFGHFVTGHGDANRIVLRGEPR